jgi:hypothetical protein
VLISAIVNSGPLSPVEGLDRVSEGSIGDDHIGDDCEKEGSFRVGPRSAGVGGGRLGPSTDSLAGGCTKVGLQHGCNRHKGCGRVGDDLVCDGCTGDGCCRHRSTVCGAEGLRRSRFAVALSKMTLRRAFAPDLHLIYA